MKPALLTLVAGATLALAASLAPAPAAAQAVDYYKLLAVDTAAFLMRPFAVLPSNDERRQRFAYGDRYGILRVVELRADRTREEWRSRTLDGPVLELRVEDLDGLGGVDIICRTATALYVFDEDLDLSWESLGEDYRSFGPMAIANMDDDPAYEIVTIADNYLVYIDGARFAREFRSTQTFNAVDLAVGNVDADFTQEVVLDNGRVLDATRGEPEWETERFGTRVVLLDIDGDGIQEILGWSEGQPLRIFEADERQEKPLQ